MSEIDVFDKVSDLNLRLTDIVKQYSSVFILCDENTELHCLPHISPDLSGSDVIRIKSGEEHKNIDSVALIWSFLTEKLADRRSLLINLGGGVICDMGGFAASCYKRGIDFVNLPTTLLAMADASVGGKTGVDFNGYKNQIGVFHEAKHNLIFPVFLKTLGNRQIRSGLAEVIKHYLIADAASFHEISNKGDKIIPDRSLIERAIDIKSQFVRADPFEKNIRKALNFGHTIGHAIESHYLNSASPLLHGEAVAIGMAVETVISDKKGILSPVKTNEVLSVLKALFDLKPIPRDDMDGIIDITAQDKKRVGVTNRFTLLRDIGAYQLDIEVSRDTITEAITAYNKLP